MEEPEKMDNGTSPTMENDTPSNSVKNCTLCGCSTPAVKCDKCGSQTFCLSCDDMYHRHPKRRYHLRKAVDSIWNTYRSPRLRKRTELPGDPSKIPVPPPRTKKRHLSSSMFGPGFEVPMFGHKGFWQQKKLIDSQKMPTSIKTNLSVSPEPNQGNISPNSQTNVNDNTASNKFTDNPDTQSLQRRSSADSPSAMSNPALPIHVFVPGVGPMPVDMQGRSTLGYHESQSGNGLHHSASTTDISATSPQQMPPTYHFPPHMHPFMHPHLNPYPPALAHFNCPQCLSASWSNLMSPNMAAYHQLHMQQQQPWEPQSPISRSQNSPASETVIRPNQSPLSYQASGSLFSSPVFPYPNGGSFSPGVQAKTEPELPMEVQEQNLRRLLSPTPPPVSSANVTNEPETHLQQTIAGSEEMEEEEDVNVDEDDENFIIPEKPMEEWACVHCTYVNPPGSHICEVCCKTSYRKPNESKKSTKRKRENKQAVEKIVDNAVDMNERSQMQSLPVSGKLNKTDADMPTSHFPQKVADTSCLAEVNIDEMDKEVEVKHETQEVILKKDEAIQLLTTETQTLINTTTTDVQTQKVMCMSTASSTDGLFSMIKHEMSIQTEFEDEAPKRSISTDPMISSQSMESLLSGVSAPPYHNRRAGMTVGNSFSTQSLSAFERGRSRSPMPRSSSMYGEMRSYGRGLNFFPQEPMAPSWGNTWLASDPMYYKPHALAASPSKDEYFDGNWGSVDRLNRKGRKTEEVKGKYGSKPRYHRSLEDLNSERMSEAPSVIQCLQTVKNAERCGFSVEDLQVAYFNCGKGEPLFWLQENWEPLIQSVISLAAKCAEDNEEHDVGPLTTAEAKHALRNHKGNIWDAVTDCIEVRQRKILELTVRGNFTQKQIVEALKNNGGNVELAYADLIRTTSKLFKHILSPGLSEESEDINIHVPSSSVAAEADTKGGMKSKPKDEVLDTEENSAEKKRSDFLSKLTAIREAQSERRKAREEKEIGREIEKVSLEDVFTAAEETEILPSSTLEGISEKLSTEVLKAGLMESVEIPPDLESSQFEILTTDTDEKLCDEYYKNVECPEAKKDEELPEDLDGHWVDSQGEWIEEFSDEQWDDEGEGEWVTVRTRYKKLESDLDVEAMEMAALWEKEELADDVFEDEPKGIGTTDSRSEVIQTEVETEWSGIELKAELSADNIECIKLTSEQDIEDEYDLDANDNWIVEDTEKLLRSPESEVSINEEDFEDEHFNTKLSEDKSPLFDETEVILKLGSISEKQHTESQVQRDEYWGVDVKKMAPDSLEGSIDEEWEKLDLQKCSPIHKSNEQLFPTVGPDDGKTINLSKEVGDYLFSEDQSKANEVYNEKSNVETLKSHISEHFEEVPQNPKVEKSLMDVSFKTIDESASPEQSVVQEVIEQPKPPIRRKSKLNEAEIKQALTLPREAEPIIEHEIPPALPKKTREKLSSGKVQEISVAVQSQLDDSQTIVAKTTEEESQFLIEDTLTFDDIEKDSKIELEGSPATSYSCESDSNFFADSESEVEVSKLRHKKQHHKTELKEALDAMNMDLEEELPSDEFDDSCKGFEEEPMIEESNFERFKFARKRLHDEIPFIKSADEDELLDSHRYFEEGPMPKAFRESAGRPLQLFRATPSFEEKTTVEESIEATSEKKPIPSDFIQQNENLATTPADLQFSQNLDETTWQQSEQIHAMQMHHIEEMAVSSNIEVMSKDDIQPNLSQPDQIPFHENAQVQQQSTIEYPTEIFEKPEVQIEEAEIPALSEMEATSAAADYFFGRYNEVTVVRKVKKKPLVSKTQKIPETSSIVKPMFTSALVVADAKTEKSNISSADANLLSKSQVFKSSEIKDSTLQSKQVIDVEKTQEIQLETKPDIPMDINPEIKQETKEEKDSYLIEVLPSSVPLSSKQPDTNEYISFADDYFFGSYNQVTVPKKGKKKGPLPTSRTKGPLEKSLSLEKAPLHVEKSEPLSHDVTSDTLIQSAHENTDNLLSDVPSNISQDGDSSVIPQYEKIPETEHIQEVSEKLISDVSLNRTSSAPDNIENLQLRHTTTTVETLPHTEELDEVILDKENISHNKTVRFEDPQDSVIPPPRGKKKKKDDSLQLCIAGNTNETSTFVGDEYLFGRYNEISQSTKSGFLSKKKLPPGIEDLEQKIICVPFDNLPQTCVSSQNTDEGEESLLSSDNNLLTESEYVHVDIENVSSYEECFTSLRECDDVATPGYEKSEIDNTNSTIESAYALNETLDSEMTIDNCNLVECKSLDVSHSVAESDVTDTSLISPPLHSDNKMLILQSESSIQDLYFSDNHFDAPTIPQQDDYEYEASDVPIEYVINQSNDEISDIDSSFIDHSDNECRNQSFEIMDELHPSISQSVENLLSSHSASEQFTTSFDSSVGGSSVDTAIELISAHHTTSDSLVADITDLVSQDICELTETHSFVDDAGRNICKDITQTEFKDTKETICHDSLGTTVRSTVCEETINELHSSITSSLEQNIAKFDIPETIVISAFSVARTIVENCLAGAKYALVDLFSNSESLESASISKTSIESSQIATLETSSDTVEDYKEGIILNDALEDSSYSHEMDSGTFAQEENLVFDDSYMSAVSRFYEEWIENAHSVSPQFVNTTPKLSMQQQLLCKHSGGSLPSSECSSNDSFESIDDNEMETFVLDPSSFPYRSSDVYTSDYQKLPSSDHRAQKENKLDKSGKPTDTKTVSTLNPQTCNREESIYMGIINQSQIVPQHIKSYISPHQEDTIITKFDQGTETDTEDLETMEVKVTSVDESCQTEDYIFEEESFFDTLDENFPYMLPEKAIDFSSSKTEIGIQCQMTQCVYPRRSSVDNFWSISKTHTVSATSDTPKFTIMPTILQENSFVLNTDHGKISVLESDKESAQESDSFESQSDSDSDIFVDFKPFEHEDIRGTTKKSTASFKVHIIEVDSGTGSISGSDVGEQFMDVDSHDDNWVTEMSVANRCEESELIDKTSDLQLAESRDKPNRPPFSLDDESVIEEPMMSVDQHIKEKEKCLNISYSIEMEKKSNKSHIEISNSASPAISSEINFSIDSDENKLNNQTKEDESILSEINNISLCSVAFEDAVMLNSELTEKCKKFESVSETKEFDSMENWSISQASPVSPSPVPLVPSVTDIKFIEIEEPDLEEPKVVEDFVTEYSNSTVEYFYGPLPLSVVGEITVTNVLDTPDKSVKEKNDGLNNITPKTTLKLEKSPYPCPEISGHEICETDDVWEDISVQMTTSSLESYKEAKSAFDKETACLPCDDSTFSSSENFVEANSTLHEMTEDRQSQSDYFTDATTVSDFELCTDNSMSSLVMDSDECSTASIKDSDIACMDSIFDSVILIEELQNAKGSLNDEDPDPKRQNINSKQIFSIGKVEENVSSEIKISQAEPLKTVQYPASSVKIADESLQIKDLPLKQSSKVIDFEKENILTASSSVSDFPNSELHKFSQEEFVTGLQNVDNCPDVDSCGPENEDSVSELLDLSFKSISDKRSTHSEDESLEELMHSLGGDHSFSSELVSHNEYSTSAGEPSDIVKYLFYKDVEFSFKTADYPESESLTSDSPPQDLIAEVTQPDVSVPVLVDQQESPDDKCKPSTSAKMSSLNIMTLEFLCRSYLNNSYQISCIIPDKSKPTSIIHCSVNENEQEEKLLPLPTPIKNFHATTNENDLQKTATEILSMHESYSVVEQYSSTEETKTTLLKSSEDINMEEQIEKSAVKDTVRYDDAILLYQESNEDSPSPLKLKEVPLQLLVHKTSDILMTSCQSPAPALLNHDNNSQVSVPDIKHQDKDYDQKCIMDNIESRNEPSLSVPGTDDFIEDYSLPTETDDSNGWKDFDSDHSIEDIEENYDSVVEDSLIPHISTALIYDNYNTQLDADSKEEGLLNLHTEKPLEGMKLQVKDLNSLHHENIVQPTQPVIKNVVDVTETILKHHSERCDLTDISFHSMTEQLDVSSEQSSSSFMDIVEENIADVNLNIEHKIFSETSAISSTQISHESTIKCDFVLKNQSICENDQLQTEVSKSNNIFPVDDASQSVSQKHVHKLEDDLTEIYSEAFDTKNIISKADVTNEVTYKKTQKEIASLDNVSCLSGSTDKTLTNLTDEEIDVFVDVSSSLLNDMDEDEFKDSDPGDQYSLLAADEAISEKSEVSTYFSESLALDVDNNKLCTQKKSIEQLKVTTLTNVPSTKQITELAEQFVIDSKAYFAEECEVFSVKEEEVGLLSVKSIPFESSCASVSNVSYTQNSDQKEHSPSGKLTPEECTKSSADKADTVADFSELSEISDFPTDSNGIEVALTVSRPSISELSLKFDSLSIDEKFIDVLSHTPSLTEESGESTDLEVDYFMEELDDHIAQADVKKNNHVECAVVEVDTAADISEISEVSEFPTDSKKLDFVTITDFSEISSKSDSLPKNGHLEIPKLPSDKVISTGDEHFAESFDELIFTENAKSLPESSVEDICKVDDLLNISTDFDENQNLVTISDASASELHFSTKSSSENNDEFQHLKTKDLKNTILMEEMNSDIKWEELHSDIMPEQLSISSIPVKFKTDVELSSLKKVESPLVSFLETNLDSTILSETCMSIDVSEKCSEPNFSVETSDNMITISSASASELSLASESLQAVEKLTALSQTESVSSSEKPNLMENSEEAVDLFVLSSDAVTLETDECETDDVITVSDPSISECSSKTKSLPLDDNCTSYQPTTSNFNMLTNSENDSFIKDLDIHETKIDNDMVPLKETEFWRVDMTNHFRDLIDKEQCTGSEKVENDIVISVDPLKTLHLKEEPLIADKKTGVMNYLVTDTNQPSGLLAEHALSSEEEEKSIEKEGEVSEADTYFDFSEMGATSKFPLDSDQISTPAAMSEVSLELTALSVDENLCYVSCHSLSKETDEWADAKSGYGEHEEDVVFSSETINVIDNISSSNSNEKEEVDVYKTFTSISELNLEASDVFTMTSPDHSDQLSPRKEVVKISSGVPEDLNLNHESPVPDISPENIPITAVDQASEKLNNSISLSENEVTGKDSMNDCEICEADTSTNCSEIDETSFWASVSDQIPVFSTVESIASETNIGHKSLSENEKFFDVKSDYLEYTEKNVFGSEAVSYKGKSSVNPNSEEENKIDKTASFLSISKSSLEPKEITTTFHSDPLSVRKGNECMKISDVSFEDLNLKHESSKPFDGGGAQHLVNVPITDVEQLTEKLSEHILVPQTEVRGKNSVEEFQNCEGNTTADLSEVRETCDLPAASNQIQVTSTSESITSQSNAEYKSVSENEKISDYKSDHLEWKNSAFFASGTVSTVDKKLLTDSNKEEESDIDKTVSFHSVSESSSKTKDVYTSIHSDQPSVAISVKLPDGLTDAIHLNNKSFVSDDISGIQHPMNYAVSSHDHLTEKLIEDISLLEVKEVEKDSIKEIDTCEADTSADFSEIEDTSDWPTDTEHAPVISSKEYTESRFEELLQTQKVSDTSCYSLSQEKDEWTDAKSIPQDSKDEMETPLHMSKAPHETQKSSVIVTDLKDSLRSTTESLNLTEELQEFEKEISVNHASGIEVMSETKTSSVTTESSFCDLSNSNTEKKILDEQTISFQSISQSSLESSDNYSSVYSDQHFVLGEKQKYELVEEKVLLQDNNLSSNKIPIQQEPFDFVESENENVTSDVVKSKFESISTAIACIASSSENIEIKGEFDNSKVDNTSKTADMEFMRNPEKSKATSTSSVSVNRKFEDEVFGGRMITDLTYELQDNPEAVVGIDVCDTAKQPFKISAPSLDSEESNPSPSESLLAENLTSSLVVEDVSSENKTYGDSIQNEVDDFKLIIQKDNENITTVQQFLEHPVHSTEQNTQLSELAENISVQEQQFVVPKTCVLFSDSEAVENNYINKTPGMEITTDDNSASLSKDEFTDVSSQFTREDDGDNFSDAGDFLEDFLGESIRDKQKIEFGENLYISISEKNTEEFSAEQPETSFVDDYSVKELDKSPLLPRSSVCSSNDVKTDYDSSLILDTSDVRLDFTCFGGKSHLEETLKTDIEPTTVQKDENTLQVAAEYTEPSSIETRPHVENPDKIPDTSHCTVMLPVSSDDIVVEERLMIVKPSSSVVVDFSLSTEKFEFKNYQLSSYSAVLEHSLSTESEQKENIYTCDSPQVAPSSEAFQAQIITNDQDKKAEEFKSVVHISEKSLISSTPAAVTDLAELEFSCISESSLTKSDTFFDIPSEDMVEQLDDSKSESGIEDFGTESSKSHMIDALKDIATSNTAIPSESFKMITSQSSDEDIQRQKNLSSISNSSTTSESKINVQVDYCKIKCSSEVTATTFTQSFEADKLEQMTPSTYNLVESSVESNYDIVDENLLKVCELEENFESLIEDDYSARHSGFTPSEIIDSYSYIPADEDDLNDQINGLDMYADSTLPIEYAEQSPLETIDDFHYKPVDLVSDNEIEGSLYESWSDRSFDLDENVLQYEQCEDEFTEEHLLYEEAFIEDEEAILREVDLNLQKFDEINHIAETENVCNDMYEPSPNLIDDFDLEFEQSDLNLPPIEEEESLSLAPDVDANVDQSYDEYRLCTENSENSSSNVDSFVSSSNQHICVESEIVPVIENLYKPDEPVTISAESGAISLKTCNESYTLPVCVEKISSICEISQQLDSNKLNERTMLKENLNQTEEICESYKNLEVTDICDHANSDPKENIVSLGMPVSVSLEQQELSQSTEITDNSLEEILLVIKSSTSNQNIENSLLLNTQEKVVSSTNDCESIKINEPNDTIGILDGSIDETNLVHSIVTQKRDISLPQTVLDSESCSLPCTEGSNIVHEGETKPPNLPPKKPNIVKKSFQEFPQTDEEKPSLPRKMSKHRLSLTKQELSSECESANVAFEETARIPSRSISRSCSISSSASVEIESKTKVEHLGQKSDTGDECNDENIPKRKRERKESLPNEEIVQPPPRRRSKTAEITNQSANISERKLSDSERTVSRRRSSTPSEKPIPRKRLSIEDRMAKLQTEGKCTDKDKAFIAAKLIEMQFEEDDALLASRQCSSVYHAVKFLTQLCEMCNCRYPIHQMASMVHCPHKACRDCLKAHFTTLIYDRSIFALLCPICHKPDISDQNIQDYFNHLDMMLRRILKKDVYDLFQRKLRDEVLTKDPNFHWCSQCSSGFIASPRLKKLYCPDCSAITCALCHQTWELEHEGVHCERFQQWKDMHTPEPPPAGLVKAFAERGITCPSCGIKFPHASGGCMLYKCTHCNFEFCAFCLKPYMKGKECPKSSSCENLGIHSHHPHNCLFFIRDQEPLELQQLLINEKIPFLKIPPPDQIVKSRCQVREQKHVHGTVLEDRCGRDIEPYFAGLCRVHYKEYLAELLKKHRINQTTSMTTLELQFMLRKARIFIPERVKDETSEDYHARILKIVTTELTS